MAGAEALGQVQAVAVSKDSSRLMHKLLPKDLGSDLCHMVTDGLLHCKGMMVAGIHPGMKALGQKRASLEGCSILDTPVYYEELD